MSACCCVFERSEKKFILSEEKYRDVIARITPHMTADHYGLSTIGNLYFDNDNYDQIRHSIDKPYYKEKLRLRAYGCPSDNDPVFLEIKKKLDTIVYKRRICLSLVEAENYIHKGIRPESGGQILNEIDYFFKSHGNPVPKIYNAYERIAYYGNENKSLRLTFDSNIRGRQNNLTLRDQSGCELLDFGGKYIMEIKVTDAMPMWMVNMLSDLELYSQPFSKVGSIYKNTLKKERRLCSRAF